MILLDIEKIINNVFCDNESVPEGLSDYLGQFNVDEYSDQLLQNKILELLNILKVQFGDSKKINQFLKELTSTYFEDHPDQENLEKWLNKGDADNLENCIRGHIFLSQNDEHGTISISNNINACLSVGSIISILEKHNVISEGFKSFLELDSCSENKLRRIDWYLQRADQANFIDFKMIEKVISIVTHSLKSQDLEATIEINRDEDNHIKKYVTKIKKRGSLNFFPDFYTDKKDPHLSGGNAKVSPGSESPEFKRPIVAIKKLNNKPRRRNQESPVRELQREQRVHRYFGRNSAYDSENLMLVYDWQHGVSLDRLEQESIEWDIKDKLNCALSLVEVIKILHESGRIHGDIKPANIILSNPDKTTPKLELIDFGTVRRFEASKYFPSTPEFCSPYSQNQFQDDIFALGITLATLFPDLIEVSHQGLMGTNFKFKKCDDIHGIAIQTLVKSMIPDGNKIVCNIQNIEDFINNALSCWDTMDNTILNEISSSTINKPECDKNDVLYGTRLP